MTDEEKEAWLIINVAKVGQRARKNKLPFNLSYTDLTIPDCCPILGIPLAYHINGGKKGGQPDSPSIDRLNPAKGYVKGNCKVISLRANELKNNGTLENFQKIVEYLTS